jgi:hypothetical protein
MKRHRERTRINGIGMEEPGLVGMEWIERKIEYPNNPI